MYVLHDLIRLMAETQKDASCALFREPVELMIEKRTIGDRRQRLRQCAYMTAEPRTEPSRRG